jgi:hypothetical protein
MLNRESYEKEFNLMKIYSIARFNEKLLQKTLDILVYLKNFIYIDSVMSSL